MSVDITSMRSCGRNIILRSMVVVRVASSPIIVEEWDSVRNMSESLMVRMVSDLV